MVRMIDDSIKRQLSKRMDFFLKYFPVRVRNVGEDAVAARQLIWAFKDARVKSKRKRKLPQSPAAEAPPLGAGIAAAMTGGVLLGL